MALILIFGFFEEIIEKIIESRYIGIFLIIGKIIDIDIKLLNLSVIWRNYRQHYRYRNWLEIYRKIIDIEKNDVWLEIDTRRLKMQNMIKEDMI